MRDYGHAGQLGLEGSPGEYVAALVAVFREVRRVLRPGGTCWLNLGDSYASGEVGRHDQKVGKRADDANGVGNKGFGERRQQARLETGLKPKDLVGIPWRVAFALQADGWYLRSDIVWAKPNPMPESVTDRPTKAHEYVFLLSKSPRYYFDQEAVRESYTDSNESRFAAQVRHGTTRSGITVGARHEDDPHAGQVKHRGLPGVGTTFSGFRAPATFVAPTLDESLPPEAPRGPDGRRATAVKGANGSIQHRDGERWPNTGRNVRSVWTIATQPYAEAHFAVFPEELPRRCILAGSAPGGVILDPFAGSGTTGLVARKHGRRSILIELSPAYAALAAERCSQLSLLAVEAT